MNIVWRFCVYNMPLLFGTTIHYEVWITGKEWIPTSETCSKKEGGPSALS